MSDAESKPVATSSAKPRRVAAAIMLAEVAVAWWEDHNREECHFCGPRDDGAHDFGCPVAAYVEAANA